MNALKWFGLWLFSLIGLMSVTPVIALQIAIRLIKDNGWDLDYYFRQLAVANDVSVGSVLYGSRHTVSAITGQKAHYGGWWHQKQEKVIDLFFGKNHCRNEAIDEKLIGGDFR